MNPREKAFLSVATQLDRKAKLAAAYWGVRSACIGGTAPFAALSYKDQKSLKTEGNAAIRMNDLFKASTAEIQIIRQKYPNLARFVREIDYPKEMWWSDTSIPTQARPSSIRENWSSARSLALAGEAEDPENDYSEETDGGADGTIACRNQREREEIIALIEDQRARGEDHWAECLDIPSNHPDRAWKPRFLNEYPVLESQASFSARGSNDDLDELFGEEPKDPRSDRIPFDKLRQWTPDKYESFFVDNGMSSVVPSGDFFTGDDGKWDGHRFTTRLVTDDLTGRPVKGGFVNRAMFFEERDRLLEGLTTDYQEAETHQRHPHLKWPEMQKMGITRDYRGPWPFALPHGDVKETGALPTPVNPAAPEKPKLRKGQRHVIVSHKSDGSTFLCAPSY